MSPLVSHSPAAGMCVWDLSTASSPRTAASGGRGIMLFPSAFGHLPGPIQLFPVTQGQAEAQGARSAGSWGPVRHLHVNVFKAISGLAIIPTALGDKYRRGAKSPSGRQAALGSVDGCAAINKSAKPLPSHTACRRAGFLATRRAWGATGRAGRGGLQRSDRGCWCVGTLHRTAGGPKRFPSALVAA